MLSKQEMKTRARDLRKESTDAELSLWYTLRNRRLNGYKFHRQYVVGSYIIDFVCLEKKIVIEVDGGQHAENISYDETRTAYLNTRGFRVLRYWNNEVLNKMESVLGEILECLESSV
jgi:very-short-patch-repair endonuclease